MPKSQKLQLESLRSKAPISDSPPGMACSIHELRTPKYHEHGDQVCRRSGRPEGVENAEPERGANHQTLNNVIGSVLGAEQTVQDILHYIPGLGLELVIRL